MVMSSSCRLPPQDRRSSNPPPAFSFGNCLSKTPWMYAKFPFLSLNTIFFSPKPDSFKDIFSSRPGILKTSFSARQIKLCVQVSFGLKYGVGRRLDQPLPLLVVERDRKNGNSLDISDGVPGVELVVSGDLPSLLVISAHFPSRYYCFQECLQPG